MLLCRCADGQGQTKDTLDLSSSLTLISVLERLLPHLAAQVLAAPLVALKVSAEIPKLSREREREPKAITLITKRQGHLASSAWGPLAAAPRGLQGEIQASDVHDACVWFAFPQSFIAVCTVSPHRSISVKISVFARWCDFEFSSLAGLRRWLQ